MASSVSNGSKQGLLSQSSWFVVAGLFLVLAILVLFPIVLSSQSESNCCEAKAGQIVIFGYPTNWIAWLSVLSLIAGMIGAYIDIARNAFANGTVGREQSGLKRIAQPRVLFLDLLVGGLAGFIGGLLLPTALLQTGSNLHAFNPAALTILSSGIGFGAKQMLASVIDRIEQALADAGPAALAPEAVEESFRRVLTAPPLVEYNGYLTCVVRSGGVSCMEGQKAYLMPGVDEYQVEVRLEPNPPSVGASVEVMVDSSEITGKLEGNRDALFTIEASADGLEVLNRRAEINARTGRISDPTLIRLRRSDFGLLGGEGALRLILSQASQMMQVLVVPIKGV